MNDECEKVKKDLRRIRVLSHQIECVVMARDRHIKYMAHMTDETEKARLQAVIDSMKVDKLIAESNELKSRYMDLINELEPIDRTIVYECYILGVPQWKVGRNVGYSENGVHNRLNKIIDKLSKAK